MTVGQQAVQLGGGSMSTIGVLGAIVSEVLYLCYTGTLKSLPPLCKTASGLHQECGLHACLYIRVFCHLCVLLFTVAFCMPSGPVR